MEKCYNIRFTGEVQDAGFRKLVENIASSYNLHGFVFNDTDGSVKLFCCCENGIIEDFLAEIRNKSHMHGASIENINKEQDPFRPYLPDEFHRIQTDAQVDIGRKLDTGIDELVKMGIILGSVDSKLGSVDSKLGSVDSKLDIFIEEQHEHNTRMEEHNTRMEGYIHEQREHNKRMEEHNTRMEGYTHEQREHNKRMEEHNTRMEGYIHEQREHNLRLEKILEKLSEK